jgi:hypothetical protein
MEGVRNVHRKALITFAIVTLAAGVGGGTAPHAMAAATGSVHTARESSDSPATLRVLTEPSAGMAPIYALITGARSSVELTMNWVSSPPRRPL